MPSLKLLKGSAPQREYHFDSGILLLGREERCDVRFPDEQVSRQHAQILRDGQRYYLVDLASRNSTYLNGKRVEPNVRFPLKNNDLITVFKYVLTFSDPGADSSFGKVPIGTADPVQVVDDPGATLGVQMPRGLDSSSGSWEFRTAVNSEAKLRAMMQITRDLHNTLALDDVLVKVLASLLKIFSQADCAVAILIDQDDGEPVTKAVRYRDPNIHEPVFLSRTLIQHVLSTRKGIIFDNIQESDLPLSHSIVSTERRSVICAPLLDLQERPLGLLQLDTKHTRSRFSSDDLDLLSSVGLQVSLSVEDSRLHEIALRDRENQRELEVAREIQLGLLPNDVPAVNGYNFYDFYAPARQVGGDYYDYMPLANGRWGVVVGDVAGKGVSAAILMAKLSSEIRVHLASGLSPPEICARVNYGYCERSPQWRFVTTVLMVLDPQTHEITLVNAGHMRPLLRRDDGTVEDVGNNESGLPLGVDPSTAYRECKFTIQPGELLVLYSDGVTDAVNEHETRFGVDGLRARLAADSGTATEFGERIIDELQNYIGDQQQVDDICLLAISRNPGVALLRADQ